MEEEIIQSQENIMSEEVVSEEQKTPAEELQKEERPADKRIKELLAKVKEKSSELEAKLLEIEKLKQEVEFYKRFTDVDPAELIKELERVKFEVEILKNPKLSAYSDELLQFREQYPTLSLEDLLDLWEAKKSSKGVVGHSISGRTPPPTITETPLENLSEEELLKLAEQEWERKKRGGK